MSILEEIEKYSDEAHKPIIMEVFKKYHWSNQWSIMIKVNWHRYGSKRHESYRIFSPTGAALDVYYAPRLEDALQKLLKMGTTQEVETGIGMMPAKTEAALEAEKLLEEIKRARSAIAEPKEDSK